MTTFRTFWHGKPLPRMHAACLQSFIDCGHHVELYAYDELEAPAEVTIVDAARILPRSRIFTYRRGPGAGSVAAFSNLFRYTLLLQAGGWWIDADVACPGNPIPEADAFCAWQSDDLVGNAILKLPAGSDLARRLRDECVAAGEDTEWGETGPNLLTRLVRDAGLNASVAAAATAYPVRYQDFAWFAQPKRRAEIEAAASRGAFVHLWYEMFRRYADRDAVDPGEGSWLDALFRRHTPKLALKEPA